MPPHDPASLVISFGKYKGSTVEELLARDPSYAQWLLGQSWLAQRFAELHAAIVSRGAAPDDTPEHNAIQARFADHAFREAFLKAAVPTLLAQAIENSRAWCVAQRQSRRDAISKKLNEIHNLVDHYAAYPPHENSWTAKHLADALVERAKLDPKLDAAEWEIASPLPPILLSTAAAFERSGVDVCFGWGCAETSIDHPHLANRLDIEIKPSLGDDYPTVMRQMQRTGSKFLLIDAYAGSAVPLPQLRNMFLANGCTLVTLAEIEAQLAPNQLPAPPTIASVPPA